MTITLPFGVASSCPGPRRPAYHRPCPGFRPRNVSLVGWGGSAGVGDEDGAVLSCQSRQSRNASYSATRGVWLSEGRITSLAHLTVTGERIGSSWVFRRNTAWIM